LAATLADAFWDDPVQQFLLPHDGSRTRRLTSLFTLFLRGHYLTLGATSMTADHAGAALWAPPGRAVVPPGVMVKQIPGTLRALGRRSLLGVRTLKAVEKVHPKEPHWYLGVLGVRQAHQGKGLGSALLQPVLQRCDAEGVPAYLESSKHDNIAFYRRHGFEVTRELPLPKGGPPVWCMWREPRPPE
jgi:ribosomal protein S18 acetylase RimI-like enzyme